MSPVFVSLLDYVGVATFATSNAIVLRRSGTDLVATVLLALVAAIGGGTIRDLLIARPVFWVVNPLYVGSCVLASSLVWFLGVRRHGSRIVVLIEAVGIGCYAVVGAAKAQDAGVGIAASIILGGVTATFGGIVSDALAGRETVLARKDIYVTAALLAAATYRLLAAVSVPTAWATAAGIGSGAGLRLLALVLDWKMPGPPQR